MPNVYIKPRSNPGGTNIRCFWLLGVWGLHVQRELVPAGAARELGWRSHHSEGATAHSAKCCCLGQQVEGPHSILLFFFCDNAAVVAIINSGRSKMDRAMHLMRCLSFFLARWEVSMVCRHIPGVQNGAADALSRDDLHSFQRLVPGVDEVPTAIPNGLLQCLVFGTRTGQG